MAPQYKLKVIRVPLEERPPDIKPNFGKLDNLHLDLLENKKRLKPGLPLIPITKVVPKPQNKSPSPSPPSKKPEKDFSEKKKEQKGGKVLKNKKEEENDDIMKDFADDDITPKKISPKKASKDDPDELEIEMGDDEDDPQDDAGEPSPSLPPKGKDSPSSGSAKDEPLEEEDYEPEETPQDTTPQLSPEEQEREETTEFRVKLKLLKRQYPTYAFQEWTDHTDLPTLKSIYSESFKECTMDENLAMYKKFLYGGFVAIELLAVKIGMTSFRGFAKYQMQKKEKYERLLIELGEKSYVNFANNWPVELKLVGMLLLDAGMFYIGKIVTDYAGEEMATMIFETFGIPLPKRKVTKPKMRGPSTRPEDIRKMAGNN